MNAFFPSSCSIPGPPTTGLRTGRESNFLAVIRRLARPALTGYFCLLISGEAAAQEDNSFWVEWIRDNFGRDYGTVFWDDFASLANPNELNGATPTTTYRGYEGSWRSSWTKNGSSQGIFADSGLVVQHDNLRAVSRIRFSVTNGRKYLAVLLYSHARAFRTSEPDDLFYRHLGSIGVGFAGEQNDYGWAHPLHLSGKGYTYVRLNRLDYRNFSEWEINSHLGSVLGDPDQVDGLPSSPVSGLRTSDIPGYPVGTNWHYLAVELDTGKTPWESSSYVVLDDGTFHQLGATGTIFYRNSAAQLKITDLVVEVIEAEYWINVVALYETQETAPIDFSIGTITSISRMPDSPIVEIEFQPSQAAEFILEYSADLKSWVSLGSAKFGVPDGILDFVHSSAMSKGYYRVRRI